MNRARTNLAALGSVLVLLLNSGCGEDASDLRSVLWAFHLNDSTTFKLRGTYHPEHLEFFNGPETLHASILGTDSFSLPPFDGLITGHWNAGQFEGQWTDGLRNDYRVRLTATETRDAASELEEDVPWKHWDAFMPGNDSTPFGTLMLQVTHNRIQGTIATPTGDFRHLHGAPRSDGSWEFGTFDGAHLYHLRTWPAKNGLFGTFHSGNHYASTFRGDLRAHAPETAPLEAPLRDSIPFEAHAYNRDGERLIWTAETLPGEITVIDIMGTWCPNCLDEIRLLKRLAAAHPDVAFMSVAFERGADEQPERAWQRIEQYRNELNVEWPMYLGGPANKQKAGDAFPFLERVASFPTTLFVHRDGRIITHSGFNGPATGAAHQAEIAAFEQNIQSLLN